MGSGGDVYYSSANNYGDVGVRPAFYLDLSSAAFTSGRGTSDSPYRVYGSGGGSASPTVKPSVTAAPKVTIDDSYAGGTKTVETYGVDVNNLLSNITVGTDKIRGPKLSVLGHDFYLFELDGKVSFSLGNVKIEAKFDAEENTIKLLGGYDFISEKVSTGSDYTSKEEYNKAYNDLKSLYNTINGGTLGGQAVRSKYNSIYNKLKKNESNLFLNIKGNFALYGKLGLDSGDVKLIEGGVIVKASASGSIDPRIGGIFYGTFGLALEASGNFALKFDGAKKPLAVDAKLKIEPAVNVGIGAGSKKAKFYIEGGLKGKLPVEILAVTGSFKANTGDSFTPLKVYAQGFLYVSGKAVLFGYDNEWQLGSDFILYPRDGDASLSGLEGLYAINKDDLVMLPRDYAGDASLMELSDEFDKQNLYPYSTPKLAALQNGKYMLLWIDDDPSKADADRTSMYYSVYDPAYDLWSAPQIAIQNDGYNEMPQICVSGDKVHIVWTRIDESLGESTDIDTMLSKLDLYYTCYDGEGFAEPILVSEADNRLCETLYSVSENNGSVIIAWADNSENDLALAEGTNHIYKREITPDAVGGIELVAEETRELHDIQLDDAGSVIYEIGSGENSVIYKEGEQIGESANDNSAFCVSEGKVYYLSGTELVEYDIASGSQSRTEMGEMTDITIVKGEGKTIALSLVPTGFTNELYQNELKDGEWGKWTRLTDYGKYIRDYSAVLENGELTLALNLVEVKDEEKGGYGNAELLVARDCSYNDIIIDDAPFYEGDVAENQPLNICFNVTNNSRKTLDSVYAVITDKAGNEMYSGDISCCIKAGETAGLSAQITIPQGFTKQDITVSLSETFDGENLANNSASLTVGYADVAFENIRIEGAGEDAVLKGTIKNIGFEGADNVWLGIYESDASRQMLMRVVKPRLDPGEEDEFYMPLPEDYQNYSHGKQAIYCELSTESEEIEFGNNSDRLILADLSEAVNGYSMSYDDNMLTIKSPRARGAILAAAYYDEEGRLTDCHMVEVSLGIGTNNIPSDGLVSGANACFMLWSEDYEPLCDSLTW